jgi:CheY-like chemotaxis protein/signal transduction histidine kinase
MGSYLKDRFGLIGILSGLIPFGVGIYLMLEAKEGLLGAVLILSGSLALLLLQRVRRSVIQPLDQLRDLLRDLTHSTPTAQSLLPDSPNSEITGPTIETMVAQVRSQQSALARARDHIKSILENIHAYIILLNGNKEVIYTNRLYQSMAGDNGFEIGSFLFRLKEAIDERVQTRTTGQQELHLKNSSDSELHFLAVISIFGEGPDRNRLRILLTITDITESKFLRLQAEKHAEALEEKVRLRTQDLLVTMEEIQKQNVELEKARKAAIESESFKTEFLARASHEIRTPLNGILGMTELLLGMSMGETLRENLGVIRVSAVHLMAVINDVLDLSKIEAGKLKLEQVPFDMVATVKALTHPLCTRAHQKGLEFLVEIPWKLPLQVIGDPHRFTQILLNLVGNAIRFTLTGHVLIRLAIRSETADSILLECSVSDTGIGIPPDKIDSIFDSFEQAELDTSRKYGGTGLGTSICKELVELMGGKIEVESQPDKGSKFSFQIPLGRQDKTTFLDSMGDLTKLKDSNVLILEPYKSSQRILSQYFSGLGMHCLSVDRVNIAEEFIRSSGLEERFDYLAVGLPLDDFDEKILESWLQKYFQDGRPRILLMIPEAYEGLKFYGFHSVINILRKPTYPVELCQALLAEGHRSAMSEPIATEEFQATERRINPLGPRILLVDDNEINRVVIHEMLSKNGYQVEEAESGLQALEFYEKGKFDLIFMDLQMPGLDGLETTRRIRSLEKPGAEKLPIVGITAGISPKDPELCLQAGMNAHILKPLTEAELTACLSSLGFATIKGQSSNQQPVSILVAEDNLLNQTLISRILVNYGFEVTVKENGALAVEDFRQHNYDLILMDLMMPVMSGFDATRKIRALEDSHSHIPILAVTADRSEGVELRCQEAGMDSYIPKPIHPKTLMEHISRYIKPPLNPAILTLEEPIRSFEPRRSDKKWEQLVSSRDKQDKTTSLSTFVLERAVKATSDGIIAMEEALKDEDGTLLSRKAHSLKGTFTYLVDDPDLMKSILRLEAQGKQSDFKTAKDELKNFSLLWKTAKARLQSPDDTESIS